MLSAKFDGCSPHDAVIVQLAPATGGFGLGQLVGSLYETEALNQGAGKSCYGAQCFRWAPLMHIVHNLLFSILHTHDLLAVIYFNLWLFPTVLKQ